MGPMIEILRGEIGKLRRESTDKRYFIDPHELKTLLTRDIIKGVIHECSIPEYQKPNIINLISNEGKIIFGILVWKKWHHELIRFIENNVLDEQLPLDIETAEKVATKTLGWELARNVQWEFLPRILTKDMSGYHCKFRDEEILPFVHEQWLGEGGFGDVFKISVSPSLQTIYSEPRDEVFIVRKRIKKLDGDFLEREKQCLQILNRFQHPNIIQLLGSYTHLDHHYFLFPHFPTDLKQFLQLQKSSGGFTNDYMFYTALQGLSSAIAVIHSLNLNTKDHDVELQRIGYHHDIRPANVLVDSKTFYLADFGLARMKPSEEVSGTNWKAGLGDYVAPECMNSSLMRQEVGRPLDIWSFGCMILEIAAYIRGGPKGVNGFHNRRYGSAHKPQITDHWFFSGTSLRKSVVDWCEESVAQADSAVFRDLLDQAALMLKIDPIDRPKAGEVYRQLSFLSLKALIEAAQQSFNKYLELAQYENGKRLEIRAIQNEYGRLVAWAKVLQLIEGRSLADCILPVRHEPQYFNGILIKLLELLNSDNKERQAEPSSKSAVIFSIRKSFHDEIQELVEQLWMTVPMLYQEKLRQVWLEESLNTEDKIDDVLHNTSLSPQSDAYSELGAFAVAKVENLRLEEDERRLSEAHVFHEAGLLLSLEKLHIERDFDEGVQIGLYDNTQVFIESVPLTRRWMELSTTQKHQFMQVRANFFHGKSWPEGFRILECLGFVEISDMRGRGLYDHCLIYTFPRGNLPGRPEWHKRTVPINLWNILKSWSKFDFPLGDKFHLAYKLVSCIRELHMAGWLHKNLNSKNVVFFKKEGRTPALSHLLERPYLINLRHSRSSENVNESERLDTGSKDSLQHYQHPDYSSGNNTFQEVFDYYSLGIILLELGSWNTLHTFLQNNRELRLNPSAFRKVLIDKYAPRLSHTMGLVYTNATLACLRADFNQENRPHSTVMEGQSMLGLFYDKVVGPLGELTRLRI